MFKSVFTTVLRTSNVFASPSPAGFALRSSRCYASASVVRLRKTLNQFLLKVHPDFFTAYPKMQSVNEKSLKQLNSFLDVLENHSGPGWNPDVPNYFTLDKNKVTQQFSIEFYMRPMDDKSSKEADKSSAKDLLVTSDARERLDAIQQQLAHHDNAAGTDHAAPATSAPVGEAGYERFKVEYSFPSEFFVKQHPVWVLEREAALCVRRLFKEARVEVPNELFTDLLHSDKQFSAKQGLKTKGAFTVTADARKSARRAMVEMMDEQLKVIPRSIMPHLKLAKFVKTGEMLTYMDFFYSQMYFYAPTLSGEQQEAALNTFKSLESFPERKYQWDFIQENKLPVLFIDTDQFVKPQQMPGFVIVPFHAAWDDFCTYLDGYLGTIGKQRAQMREEIVLAEFCETQLRSRLKLGEISYGDVSLASAISTMEDLLSGVKALENFNLEGIRLRIVSEKNPVFSHASAVLIEGENISSEAIASERETAGETEADSPAQEAPAASHGLPCRFVRTTTSATLVIARTVTAAQLEQFLNDHRDAIAAWHLVNPFSAAYLDILAGVIARLRKELKALAIHVDPELFHDKFAQVTGTVNLLANAALLKRIDLSKVTLIISTRFAVDKEHNSFYLPTSFEPEQLLRFLVSIKGKQ